MKREEPVKQYYVILNLFQNLLPVKPQKVNVIAHEDVQSKKKIADSICNASAMTRDGLESGSNRVEQLNDKSLPSYPPTFLSSRPAPIPTFPQKGRRCAFTLAEVLITLGIIGVVAALTLPALVQNYREKQTVSQLKKAYSAISQAYLSAINEYGPFESWGVAKTETGKVDEDGNRILDRSGQYLVKERLTKQMNTVQFTDSREVYNLSGKAFPTETPESREPYSFQVQDGTVYEIGYVNSSCSDISTCGEIWVILPGKKVQSGVNKFLFSIFKNGIKPAGAAGKKDRNFYFPAYCDVKDTNGQNYNQGRGCSVWVLDNENMDYLHCDGLSWDGKTKCK